MCLFTGVLATHVVVYDRIKVREDERFTGTRPVNGHEIRKRETVTGTSAVIVHEINKFEPITGTSAVDDAR